MATPTVPNSSFEVAQENLQTLDRLMNQSSGSVTNREGDILTPIPLLNQQLNDIIDNGEQAVLAIGWEDKGTFSAGATLTTPNQILSNGTNYYRWSGVFPKVVSAGSAVTPIGVGGWLLVGDSQLRSELASVNSEVVIAGVKAKDLVGSYVTPEMFGAVGNGVVNDTVAVQNAIEFCRTSSKKTVLLSKYYKVDSSSLPDIFNNAGVNVPATDCAIVVRKGVSIVGTGRGTCGFVCSNNGLMIVACPAPNAQTLEGFDILGSWQSGNSGAGHGIFTLSDGADNSLKDFRIKNIYIEKVASYGIAFQNGAPEGCEVSDCETFYTGADGFDLKARNDNATQPVANSAKNLLARRFNMRVDGSAGIDLRGVWHVSGITVRDFGEDAAKNYTGIRFRTKPPITDAYNKAAAKSTLFGFEIKSDAVGSVIGLSSGSDDVKICGGTIESVTNGVEFQGNANGSANRNVISAVTVIGASNQGFLNTIGCSSITYEACYAVGCTTGFRVEGVGTKLSSCEADGASPLSISSGAGPTTVVSPDCKFGEDSQITFYRVTNGRVAMEAKGSSTNIDIAIFPKGTSGRIRYGTHVTNADAPITGYIEVKDSGGTVRKLAVIS